MPKPGAVTIGSNKDASPRAHPQTVVFTFGASKEQELAFIVGTMADLAGKTRKTLPPVSARKFAQINSEQPLDSHMAAIRPRVAFPVPNRLDEQGGNLMVDIEFESMEDFRPDRIAAKVEPLRKLLEQRERLNDLSNYLDGNENAEKVLADLLEKMQALTKS